VTLAWELERWGAEPSGAASASQLTARFGAPPAELSEVEMSLLTPGTLQSNGTRSSEAESLSHGEAPRASRDMLTHAAGSDETGLAPSARHQRADQRLRSYGWSDRARGTVFIPIARAIELYLANESARQHSTKPSPVSGTGPKGTP
jgi:hypothetical protein